MDEIGVVTRIQRECSSLCSLLWEDTTRRWPSMNQEIGYHTPNLLTP